MKYSTIVFCLFLIESVFGYSFYPLPKFKRIHSNEPKLFKNRKSEENIIRLAKEYDINIEGNNFVKLKKDLYKRYMKNRNIYYVKDPKRVQTRGLKHGFLSLLISVNQSKPIHSHLKHFFL